jgi:hypothetical protein
MGKKPTSRYRRLLENQVEWTRKEPLLTML